MRMRPTASSLAFPDHDDDDDTLHIRWMGEIDRWKCSAGRERAVYLVRSQKNYTKEHLLSPHLVVAGAAGAPGHHLPPRPVRYFRVPKKQQQRLSLESDGRAALFRTE